MANHFKKAAVLVAAIGIVAAVPNASNAQGALYTMTNDASGNAIVWWNRAADGTLLPGGTAPTGGLGTSHGLGNQGGVAIRRGGKWILNVNAGSNDISLLSVRPAKLTLTDRSWSGGVLPISVTVHDNLIYVLNAGDATNAANISGFWMDSRGSLSAIPGSTRPLSADQVGPAQIQFSRDGHILAVTEKGTNKIDTYSVDALGMASAPTVQNSAGVTPFGFAFTMHNRLVVSEAVGGGAGASTVSSYSTTPLGVIGTLTPSIATGQSAACWVAITNSGQYAYVSNTGSKNVTALSINSGGYLNTINASGIDGITGKTPIDSAISDDDHFLYVLNAGDHSVSIFGINGDGTLTAVATATGLPLSANGLAAR